MASTTDGDSEVRGAQLEAGVARVALPLARPPCPPLRRALTRATLTASQGYAELLGGGAGGGSGVAGAQHPSPLSPP